jgi:hypothetical protein
MSRTLLFAAHWLLLTGCCCVERCRMQMPSRGVQSESAERQREPLRKHHAFYTTALFSRKFYPYASYARIYLCVDHVFRSGTCPGNNERIARPQYLFSLILSHYQYLADPTLVSQISQFTNTQWYMTRTQLERGSETELQNAVPTPQTRERDSSA